MEPAETQPAFQRARSPEHKALREQEILRGASTVLDAQGIEATTLAAIAQEAGLAKSNLYRYFDSREEILVHLFALECSDLIAEVAGKCYAMDRPNDFEVMAAAFASACAQRPRFCLLLSQLAPILERNISLEKVILLKRGLAAQLDKMAKAIHHAAPVLGSEGAYFALQISTTLVAGLWPGTNPPEVVAKALEHPDLQHFRQDFEPTLAQAMTAILSGLATRNGQ